MDLPKTLALLIFVSGCRQAEGPTPEYRPEEAGTLDHAVCLLGFTAVPLREVSTGHHLVQATINGTTGSFVLDTGANATVVDQAHAAHFRILDTSGGPGGAIGLGGGMRARQVPIEEFHIGPVDVRRDRVVTADLGQISQTLGRLSGDTIYGIIGQDVLKEHRALIDVAKPILYLMDEDQNPAPVPAERCREQAGEPE